MLPTLVFLEPSHQIVGGLLDGKIEAVLNPRGERGSLRIDPLLHEITVSIQQIHQSVPARVGEIRLRCDFANLPKVPIGKFESVVLGLACCRGITAAIANQDLLVSRKRGGMAGSGKFKLIPSVVGQTIFLGSCRPQLA